MLNEIRNKVLGGEKIIVEEVCWLFCQVEKQDLYDVVYEIIWVLVFWKFDMCFIINVKFGKCFENCKWCVQFVYYKIKVDVYDLVGKEECLCYVLYNEVQGVFCFFLVISGRKLGSCNMDWLCEIIEYMCVYLYIQLCVFLGLLDEVELEWLFKVGIICYYCNLEMVFFYFLFLCFIYI